MSDGTSAETSMEVTELVKLPGDVHCVAGEVDGTPHFAMVWVVTDLTVKMTLLDPKDARTVLPALRRWIKDST